MKIRDLFRWVACLSLAWALGLGLGEARAADALAEGFRQPPAEARPHTWWHWMNGNITKEGITADLEAMARAGLGGAQIFNVGSGIPAGPVTFLSPAWRDMVRHAAQEANRLGLELCVHNCAGWSSSGGPWNTPEHAMQTVVSSELRLQGPGRFAGKLPEPAAKLGYYRDIAVLAFPAEPGGEWMLTDRAPKVTTSDEGRHGERVADGRLDTAAELPLPTSSRPVWVQLEFARPVTARTAVLGVVAGMQGTKGTIAVSDDGRAFRTVRHFNLPTVTGAVAYLSWGGEAVTARYYRLTFSAPGSRTKRLALTEVGLTEGWRVEGLEAKAGYSGEEVAESAAVPAMRPETAGLVVARDRIIDLTAQVQADGRLEWDIPAGGWIVQRIGHTPNGRTNHPAPEGGLGLECDKLSREAFDAHWAGMMGPILADLGPLAGKTLNHVLIDSYEVGGQNWTPRFPEEFRRRRGYELRKFLPALSGRVVDDPATTERFLWDLRRTIADLYAENYYGRFAEVCHAHGLQASIEPYTGPFEALQSGAPADIPMGEFWVGSNGHVSIKLAASVAHIYGRRLVAAEAFTAKPPEHGRWQEDPAGLKAIGDLVFSQGVNRLVFHRFAHQPWLDRLPGMTMGQWGTHFDRTNTWWEQGRAWIAYLTRAQYLLQRGTFVADVAYFCGEGAPVNVRAGDPALPPGYDADSINADALLHRAEMRDGRLQLRGGTAYKVLVIPPTVRTMTPALLQRLRDLVAEGLVVLGQPPQGSPSLADQPRADATVRTLAAALWGEGDRRRPTEHAVGRGRVFRERALAEVLPAVGVYPDFEYKTPWPARLVHLHRAEGGTDIYFVSNQSPRTVTVEASFRVAGRVPELFQAETGEVTEAPVWSSREGRTQVRLDLGPTGSVFVVFRRPAGAGAGDHVVQAQWERGGADGGAAAPQLRLVAARYEETDGPGGMDVTATLAALVQRDVLHVEVTNQALGRDPTPNRRKQLRVSYAYAGGPVQTKIVPEKGVLDLYPGAEAESLPSWELARVAGGRTVVTAWEAGTVVLRRASGREERIAVRDGIAAQTLAGPWTVRFPAGWQAPAVAEFPQLVSWTERAEPGIRYFSGTATYRYELDVPAAWLAHGRVLALELGRVKNLAEVSWNGRALGICWKPPFRQELTGVAVAGRNVLEIKVTNQWANRLIGDEQLPPDCEWRGLQLKEWPAWLLAGKPSPTGRLTFTTWHHWTKDMPLLPSGLLGPVVLRAGQRVEVE